MVYTTTWTALLLGLLAPLALLAPATARAADETRSVWLEDMDLAPASQGYGRPKPGKTIIDRPLTLDGRNFQHGIGVHADFALRVDLKGSAKRFTSTVGVDDERKGQGSVRFKVWVDGRKAADTGVLRGGAPKTISVDLTGARAMILLVSSGGDDITNDHADWADAKIEYSGEAPQTMGPPIEEKVILTPEPSPSPRINGPKVFGVRPGSPFLFTIAATGNKPMTFSARGLPKGLKLDARTGRISGKVARRGTYNVTLRAANTTGSTQRPFRIVVGDTLALTPPMGWNSWYVLLDKVSDQQVRAAADAMVRSGMIDHGYSYVNIDDCWAMKPGSTDPLLSGPERDAQGRINSNGKFPDMKALTDYIHTRGLKTGIYSSPGPTTCAGYTGSYGHEEDDARRFAEWGFDFLKYDWCSYNQVVKGVTLPHYLETPAPGVLEHLKKPYQLMGDILKRQPRDIVYNLCQYGMGNVWEWGASVGGNSWRTTGDLGATNDLAQSMYTIGFGENGIEKWAGPGHWNDPDYLLLGYIHWKGEERPTPLTPNEQYSYVSLWSLLAAPFFFSGDMTKLDPFTLGLLTNDEIIDVDLDPLGKQGRRVAAPDDDQQVWARDLEDGGKAVGLFNTGEAGTEIAVKWSDLGITGPQYVRDLWRQKDLGVHEGSFTATVPRHGVVLIKVLSAHGMP